MIALRKSLVKAKPHERVRNQPKASREPSLDAKPVLTTGKTYNSSKRSTKSTKSSVFKDTSTPNNSSFEPLTQVKNLPINRSDKLPTEHSSRLATKGKRKICQNDDDDDVILASGTADFLQDHLIQPYVFSQDLVTNREANWSSKLTKRIDMYNPGSRPIHEEPTNTKSSKNKRKYPGLTHAVVKEAKAKPLAEITMEMNKVMKDTVTKRVLKESTQKPKLVNQKGKKAMTTQKHEPIVPVDNLNIINPAATAEKERQRAWDRKMRRIEKFLLEKKKRIKH